MSVQERDWEDEARRMWGEGVPASEIAARFGVTKNVFMGLARRRGWSTPRSGTGGWGCLEQAEPRTLFDRLQVYHDEMDRLVAASRAVPRVKVEKRL